MVISEHSLAGEGEGSGVWECMGIEEAMMPSLSFVGVTGVDVFNVVDFAGTRTVFRRNDEALYGLQLGPGLDPLPPFLHDSDCYFLSIDFRAACFTSRALNRGSPMSLLRTWLQHGNTWF